VNDLDIFESLTELEAKIVVELANRNGRTYEEIATAVGISERHLFRYRQKSHIKRAIRELAVQELESDIPDIMGALRRNIKKGLKAEIEELDSKKFDLTLELSTNEELQ
jgi:hypothetical protein